MFVELPEAGKEVKQGSSFGAVESVKATSDVNSPISGEVVEVNTKLTESPGLVISIPHIFNKPVLYSVTLHVIFIYVSYRVSCEREHIYLHDYWILCSGVYYCLIEFLGVIGKWRLIQAHMKMDGWSRWSQAILQNSETCWDPKSTQNSVKKKMLLTDLVSIWFFLISFFQKLNFKFLLHYIT